MTDKRNIVKDLLSACLVAELDDFLTGRGFGRKRSPMRYSRRIGEGSQLLELHFDLSPRYAPGALAHLLPQLSVNLPELNRATLEMVGGHLNLIASAETTFSLQLQNAAPRHVRTGEATRWYVFDSDSARRCVVSIREFLTQWIVPFLDTYSTVLALTEGYEQQDERLPHDRRFWLFVAAAYTILERPGMAMQVLESRFKEPHLRQQYAAPFEYVSRLLPR